MLSFFLDSVTLKLLSKLYCLGLDRKCSLGSHEHIYSYLSSDLIQIRISILIVVSRAGSLWRLARRSDLQDFGNERTTMLPSNSSSCPESASLPVSVSHSKGKVFHPLHPRHLKDSHKHWTLCPAEHRCHRSATHESAYQRVIGPPEFTPKKGPPRQCHFHQ